MGLKRAEDEAVGWLTAPMVRKVAGTFCAGNEAGRLVRGLMPARGALVPVSSGSKSRRVSSTHDKFRGVSSTRDKSLTVCAGSSVSSSSNESHPVSRFFACKRTSFQSFL